MDEILTMPFYLAAKRYGSALDFFGEIGIAPPAQGQSFFDYISGLDEFRLSDCGMDRQQLCEYFTGYISRMEAIKKQSQHTIESLTIIGGHDKSGESENLSICVCPGEVVCVVGPTGSGKSRLLEDIECLAQSDTPSGRRILINGKAPEAKLRFSVEHKPVAQLSQTMGFIMDVCVHDFLVMHAEARMLEQTLWEEKAAEIIRCANELAGERIYAGSPLTTLSGGQSRALMIADTALLSAAPIILIDEIENAGIDRRRALDVLIGKDKIVFAATHDPLIAMSGAKRLVIENGAVKSCIIPCEDEKRGVAVLESIDAKLLYLRERVRSGQEISEDLLKLFNIRQ